MTSEDTAAAKEPAAEATPQLTIAAQYVRDLSFENIAAQKGSANEGKPDIKVTVNVDAKSLGNDRFEVGLKINAEARTGETAVFIAELDYVGIFGIKNIPAENMQAVLLIECPRIIFPFARRIIADVSRDGGYPPLMLDPIDFATLYRQRLAEGAVRKDA